MTVGASAPRPGGVQKYPSSVVSSYGMSTGAHGESESSRYLAWASTASTARSCTSAAQGSG